MKSLITAVAVAAAAAWVSLPASAGIAFTFSPSSSHINVGESVVVTATISGLGDEILSAYDLNFVWNASILHYSIFSHSSGCNNLGPAWGDSSDCGFDSIANGNVGPWGNSLQTDDDEINAKQANSFVVATMTLVGDADGVATLTLGADPDFERNFVGRDALSLTVDIGTACIAVGTGDCGGGQAPEPGTYGLAAVGLLAAGVARRRARKQQG